MAIVSHSSDAVKSPSGSPFEAIHERFGSDWGDLIQTLLGFPAKREKGGEEWTYHCPFHPDEHPSFHFNIRKGVYNCFGCGEKGDAVALWARLCCNGDLKEAARQIMQVFNIPVEDGKPPRLTLRAYAQVKRLNPDLLQKWDLRDGAKGIEIPYRDEQGQEVAVRIRLAMRGEDRFRWRAGDKPILYGLWRLREFPRERLYLVEGESDCHSLWHADLPAIGVPGKAIFKPEWVRHLLPFDEIVIIEEPDARYEVLKAAYAIWSQARRKKNGPRVYALRLPVKDASELWCKNPDPNAFREALTQAELELEELDFTQPKIKAEWLCYNQPKIHYRDQIFEIPYPYLQERGELVQLELQTQKLKRKPVAPRLIIVSKTYRDEQRRLWTEVSWQEKQEGTTWAGELIERKEALDRKTLLELARWGAPVTSENASAVVKFLSAFEERNRRELKPRPAATHMGWIRWQSAPLFLLGERAIGGECKLIVEGEEEQRIVKALTTRGREAVWHELWEALPGPLPRFIVSATLAAPLTRLFGERSLLLYLCGDSRIGKTAAVYLGLAAWGDPYTLCGSAYSTAVGLERRAAILTDMPFVIDERQSANDNRVVRQLTYTLSSGRGKERGKREGGLQAVPRWKTLAIMTGEEDLVGSPWTGIDTRTCEIHVLRLFSEELSKQIYEETKEHFGHVAPKFVEKLIEEGPTRVQERRKRLLGELKANMPATAQIPGEKLNYFIGMSGVAEWLLLELLGEEGEDAFAKAFSDMWFLAGDLAKEEHVSLAEKARDYILSKFAEFQAELRIRSGGAPQPQDDRAFIEEEDGERRLYILPSVLERWLREGGFTKKRVLRDWAGLDWIVTRMERGKKKYTVRKRSPGSWEKLSHYYCLRLSAMEAENKNVPPSSEGRDDGKE